MEQLRTFLKPYAVLFLRFGIGFVFLLFAIHKLLVPEQGRVEIQGILGILDLGTVSALNYYLGIAELLVALSLFLGWNIRWFALLGAGLSMTFFLSLVVKVGLTNDPNLYRDVGLTGGAFALWILGAGPFSLDARQEKKNPPPQVSPASQ